MFDLYSSIQILGGVLFMSTFTSYATCKFYNYPFINPEYSVEKIYNRSKTMVTNLFIVTSETVFLTSNILYPRLDQQPHSLIHSSANIFLYVLCVELFYYTYHIWIHKNPLYKYIHADHHTSINVYPFDTFYINLYDYQFLILSLGVPLMIVKVNMFEHILTLYYYLTYSYLTHSKILGEHHHIHHKKFVYNFCLSIPIFDILFGTYYNNKNNNEKRVI
uniref:Fatty acid hydroxylase domain-containing protein n=1 Tax=viral metagenome TaxID=1070528 RepID=A0A6C0CUS4_9ZZZZ